MKKYIGCKMVEAEPCCKVTTKVRGGKCNTSFVLPSETKTGGSEIVKIEDGYKVRYADGYESWSPKDVFEEAYMEISDNNTITQHNVAGFIKEVYSMTIGDKTTLVKVTLVNGFELCETSSCVDPKNYNEEIGVQICLDKINDKIWHLLGFLLQTAIGGMKVEIAEKSEVKENA